MTVNRGSTLYDTQRHGFIYSCIVRAAVVMTTELNGSDVMLQVVPVSRSRDTGSTSSMSTRGCGRSEPQKVSHLLTRITRFFFSGFTHHLESPEWF